MNVRKRQEVLDTFATPLPNVPDMETDSEDDERVDRKGKGKAKTRERSSLIPKVMLISLKAGALGLNLTMANNVFLVRVFLSWFSTSVTDFGALVLL